MKARLFTVFILAVNLALMAVLVPGRAQLVGAANAAANADAQNVGLVGQIGGASYAVAIQGSYAYIGVGPWLVALDVSDPTHPNVVGQTDVLPDVVWGVAVAGDYAYVADGNSGLRVVDVSDPSAPTETGAYDTPGWAWGVAVTGDYAYVADGYSGLRVVDVSDPPAPIEVGYHDTVGQSARDVAVVGDYAYVADGDRLSIINVADPTAPTSSG